MKYLIVTNHSYMLWQFRRDLLEALSKNGDIVISMPFVGHEDDFSKTYKGIYAFTSTTFLAVWSKVCYNTKTYICNTGKSKI